MISEGVEQRSTEWYRSRMGYITGSRIYDLMKAGRNDNFSETAKSYLYQVAGERLFNKAFLEDDEIYQDYLSQTAITTKSMQWGIDMEDEAKKCFLSINKETEWADLSSCAHDSIPYFSASPDGAVLTRDDGRLRIAEVKCPSIGTFMKYRSLIRDARSLKETEPKYYWQMMAEMSCTGINGGLFVVYCPWLSSPIHYAAIELVKEDVEYMESRVIQANRFISKIL